jgi:hypothetical protein
VSQHYSIDQVSKLTEVIAKAEDWGDTYRYHFSANAWYDRADTFGGLTGLDAIDFGNDVEEARAFVEANRFTYEEC